MLPTPADSISPSRTTADPRARPEVSGEQEEKAKEEDLIVPGKRIGKLSIGMTVSEVYIVMGGADPTETFDSSNGSRMYKWGKTAVVIKGKTERVVNLSTEDSRFATAEGVRVGDSQFALEAKMGTPERRTSTPDNEVWLLWYKRRSINFMIQHGNITGIAIWPPD